MNKALLLMMALALLPASGHADWQYTKWGMKPEDAVKASHGAVKLLAVKDRKKGSPTDTEKVAEGTFQDGGVRLDVEFLVDKKSGGLVCVTYTPPNAAQNEALKQILIKRYGRPIGGGMPAGLAPVDILGWGKPDTIDYQAAKGYPAAVVHCRKGGPIG
jgi:hypothetical protein